MRELRHAAATVAQRAEHVRIDVDAIAAYVRDLPLPPDGPVPAAPPTGTEREALAAHWLILDAINFGSGWFPTLRKRDGRSGYRTIAAALEEQFALAGTWTADALTAMAPATIAGVLAQDPEHELMGLYATWLADLGRRIARTGGGSFAAVVDAAGGSAITLARTLGSWSCFADTSDYRGLRLPFLKRAQIAAADLHRAGVAEFGDLAQLTMFADNLVPHVLRLDGILEFAPDLIARIEGEELIAHGSPEEVEIRACAVQAVELMVAAADHEHATAAAVDQLLWERGQLPRYKAVPRHRCRCTAY